MQSGGLRSRRSWPRLLRFLESTDSLELETLDQVAPFVQRLIAAVDDGLDKALELVLAYMDISKAETDRIRENAYDSQIAEAFMGILGLAYPFGSLGPALERLTALQGISPGRTGSTTGTN